MADRQAEELEDSLEVQEGSLVVLLEASLADSPSRRSAELREEVGDEADSRPATPTTSLRRFSVKWVEGEWAVERAPLAAWEEWEEWAAVVEGHPVDSPWTPIRTREDTPSHQRSVSNVSRRFAAVVAVRRILGVADSRPLGSLLCNY